MSEPISFEDYRERRNEDQLAAKTLRLVSVGSLAAAAWLAKERDWRALPVLALAGLTVIPSIGGIVRRWEQLK